MDKVVIISNMLSLFRIRNDHVATDGCNERYDSLFHNFLNILSWDKCGQELNKLKCHTFYTKRIFIIITFIAPLILFNFLILTLQILQTLIVTENLCEDW
jgi:hypothetical protein